MPPQTCAQSKVQGRCFCSHAIQARRRRSKNELLHCSQQSQSIISISNNLEILWRSEGSHLHLENPMSFCTLRIQVTARCREVLHYPQSIYKPFGMVNSSGLVLDSFRPSGSRAMDTMRYSRCVHSLSYQAATMSIGGTRASVFKEVVSSCGNNRKLSKVIRKPQGGS